MTSVAPQRSLPLRVPIGVGESLDGWIERLARRNDVLVRQLLTVLGLSTHNITWKSILTKVPAAPLRRIEHQSGIDPGRLADAVLTRYTGLGWPPISGSRFCPRCLADDDVWRIRWRLPWTFACTTHHVLLAYRCPTCAQPPRREIAAAAGLHPSRICTTPTVDGRCYTDLSAGPQLLLDVDDSRMQAQDWISSRLQRYEAETTASTAADLADLEAVGAWMRSRATAQDFIGYGEPTLAAFSKYGTQRNNSQRPAPQAFADPLIVAAIAVAAVRLLSARRPEIVTRLRPLLGGTGREGRDARGYRRPLKISQSRWRTLSAGRQAAMLSALDPHLAPLDRLRFRSCTPHPRAPLPDGAAASRHHHIPQLLWPEWAVRLTPVGRFADTVREVIPCCLLVPGSPLRTYAAIAAGLRTRWRPLANTLLSGLGEPAQTAVVTAICRLADYLDEHGSPVDYRRRRQTITTDLLSWQQWQRLCFDSDAHPGQDRRHLDARRYLYQTLTGADLSHDVDDLTLRSAADRSVYLAFADRMTSPLRHALHQHARSHLEQLGIDEPLTWAPPASCAADLVLPGREPDDIDLATVHRLVLQENKPPGVVGELLGTTIDHIRYALQTAIDRPPRDWGPNSAPRAWRTQQMARALLTPEFFQREYVAGRKRLKRLQAETGIHRGMLAQYAKNAGIELANARDAHHIDEAWLRDQYLAQRRSFPAIAAELGVSEMTVTRAARHYGIPARTPGITSHPDLVTALDDTYPPDIRRAVNGQLHGWQRLRRFQQVMDHPSFNIASRHLGAHISAVITQIQRLERDIGAPLVHRGTVTTPMRPTERGAALLHALRQPRIHALVEQHGQPPRGWKPNDPRHRHTQPRTS